MRRVHALLFSVVLVGLVLPAGAAEGAAAGAVLAAEETNWPGITAEVTEFRRKGNTLTAKVRLRNGGTANSTPDIQYAEVYVLDTNGGKKYEVLKDEKGSYIAALKQGWSARWYEEMKPGETRAIWMKFPAPPAEVKTATLQIPNTPPFEDLAMQE